MKRFEMAAEFCKQLITVSSVILTVTITFYENIFSRSDKVVFVLVLGLLGLLVTSISYGIGGLGGLVTKLELQEYIESRQASRSGQVPRMRDRFVKLVPTEASRLIVIQQRLFTTSLVLFAVVCLVDRTKPHKAVVGLVCGAPPAAVWYCPKR